MIVKRFEEQVNRSKDRVAIKTEEKVLTYGELNKRTNRAAYVLQSRYPVESTTPEEQTVSLLFHHGMDAVVALLSVLKARQIYVPLDSTYPKKRLCTMLKDFGIRMIVTNNETLELAHALSSAVKNITIINIETIDKSLPDQNPQVEDSQDQMAYIICTSGTSGKPKGVLQSYKNVLFFTEHYIKELSITPEDRLIFVSSFSHDGAVEDIYPALLGGATLYPYDIKQRGVANMAQWMVKEQITVYHSVPTVFRHFITALREEETLFPSLRIVCMGAESLRKSDLAAMETFFPQALLVHMYGQTESSINTMGIIDTRKKDKNITIGRPLKGIELHLLNENGEEVEELEIGEIFVASDSIAAGYWKDPEATARVFLYDEEWGKLYRTGDFGRIHYNGKIEFIGRKDQQVKIRGFRVETGEIESQLLTHPSIRQAIVTAKETAGEEEDYLAAYYVPEKAVKASELKKYLSQLLPGYMIPAYFIQLEKIPLTASGKVDQDALPSPGALTAADALTAPRDEVEKKLAAIWSEILVIEKGSIGIDADFFQMGGHSLNATRLVSRISKSFNIEFTLQHLFEKATIRAFARIIKKEKKSIYQYIKPVPYREYYPLSSAQKRLFFLNIFEHIGTTYNMPFVFKVRGKLDKCRFENNISTLINRHEILRTSFKLIDNEPVQKIHKKVNFKVETIYLRKKNNMEETIKEIVKEFIRFFDLSQAPLLRVKIVVLSPEEHLLLFDMHHIISDGTSLGILINEFTKLYSGEKLPRLNVQYKDFSSWQNNLFETDKIREQEEYWLGVFANKVRIPDMPVDYPRDLAIQPFEANKVVFELGKDLTKKLRKMMVKNGVTLYMILLAVYTILLSKYTLQEDIVVGTPVSGRNHADLENTIGMFVNIVAMRNYPKGEKKFLEFLEEVKENSLKAFENQDYPFEKLIEKLKMDRDLKRSPLFDTTFVVENTEKMEIEIEGLTITPYKFENNTNKFELVLAALETEENIHFNLIYYSQLYKKETIETLCTHYKNILSIFLQDNNIILIDIDLTTGLQYRQENRIERDNGIESKLKFSFLEQN